MKKYELEQGKLFLKEVDDMVFDWSAVRESVMGGLDLEAAKTKMSSHARALEYGIYAGFQRETSVPNVFLYNPEKSKVQIEEFLDEFYQKLDGSDFIVAYRGKEFSVREGAKIKTTIKISEADTKDGYLLNISRTADDHKADYVGFVSFDDSKRLEELVKN